MCNAVTLWKISYIVACDEVVVSRYVEAVVLVDPLPVDPRREEAEAEEEEQRRGVVVVEGGPPVAERGVAPPAPEVPHRHDGAGLVLR